MKKTKKVFLFFCFLIGAIEQINAQNGSITSGGEASGAGGTMAFSIGQIDYNSAGPGGSVSQGNQQPYEIVAVSVKQVDERNLSVSAYPNPASDLIVVKVKNSSGKDLMYELFDLNGKLLLTKKCAGEETTVSFDQLPNDAYFLKVKENNQEIKTFKIIKNK